MCVCVGVWWPERPVCRPGCAAGPPLCWEASGGEIPRCALAADSLPLPPRVVSRPSPSRWRARPPPPPPPVLWHWCHVAAPPPPRPVGAPLRPPARLVPLPICCSPGPRPGVSRFPGPAAAPIRCLLCRRRLSADIVAGRARGEHRWPPSLPPQHPPPPRPPLRCALPSAGRAPRSASRGPAAVSSPPGIPRPSGVGGRTGA